MSEEKYFINKELYKAELRIIRLEGIKAGIWLVTVITLFGIVAAFLGMLFSNEIAVALFVAVLTGGAVAIPATILILTVND